MSELQTWHKVVFYLFMLFLTALLALIGFHFTVKLYVWYARLRGWL